MVLHVDFTCLVTVICLISLFVPRSRSDTLRSGLYVVHSRCSVTLTLPATDTATHHFTLLRLISLVLITVPVYRLRSFHILHIHVYPLHCCYYCYVMNLITTFVTFPTDCPVTTFVGCGRYVGTLTLHLRYYVTYRIVTHTGRDFYLVI